MLVITYLMMGKLGLMLALPPGYASAIFPPAGIAIAAVFVAGRAALPAIGLGSLLLNLWVAYSTHHHIAVTAFALAGLIAVASTVQAWLGGWWLRRKIGYPTSLDTPLEVVTFFISAPLICLISATISVSSLFALGLIEQSLFFSSWASWWIGDSLGVIMMLPLCLVAIGQPRNIWQKRLLTVAVPMLITFALLVLIFVMVSRWERKESLVEFDAMSNQVSEHLRLRFESQEAVLKQTSALFDYRAHDSVSKQDFHQFVSTTLAGYPMIYAIEWVPRVPKQARSQFVTQQQQLSPRFDIRQFNANKRLVSAEVRDEYFPITYIEPTRPSASTIEGFDLASMADRRHTVIKAIQSKQAVVTPPTRLVNDSGNELGLLLIYPIMDGQQEGVLCSVFKVDRLIGELFTPTQKIIHARLLDVDAGKVLYDNFAAPASEVSASEVKASEVSTTEVSTTEVNTSEVNTSEVMYRRSFSFGGRQYRLETAPSALYYQQHRGWQSWNMLAIGLFGTGLMGALLLMGTGYTARIENLVQQKTDELKESFSRFQDITSTLGQGIYVIDTTGIITFTNPKAQALLGYSEQALLGQNAHTLFHHQHIDHTPYPESECAIRQVMQTKQTYKSAEEIFWHHSGAPIYSAVSAVPLFKNHVVVGAVVVFDDISERRNIEQALRASEKSFREIIEYAPIGMAIVSLAGRFTTVNQTLCNIVGYTAEELKRLTFQEITHADDLSNDLAYVQQLLEGKIDTYQMEKRYIRKDKGIVWIQLSGSVFRDDNRQAQYFIAQIEDITERKLRNDAIQQEAYFDTLTALPNRKLLMDRLQHALAQSQRYQRSMALLFVDLDYFKTINDTLGHDVGDLVLKESAARLLACVRSMDTVARLGGDEFVILLSEISDVTDAERVAEKILSKFAAPMVINGQQVRTGTSIGVAVRSGDADADINIKLLMKQADMAMYQAKASGRNQYSVYSA